MPPSRRSTAGRCALGVAGVVLVLVSGAFGRADPTGVYRPLLPPDALTNGCYPLADGIVLDFPYQVRSDRDLPSVDGVRRELVLQWDELGTTDLEEALDRSLVEAGYRGAGPLTWTRGDHRVTASVDELPDLPADAVVRGRVVLDLPATAPASDAPACADPYSTKRFPADLEELG